MRLSCNGCRVLRKGCTDACTIRPCLQWIKTPEAQANATVFLAKFYGRAGLLNLLAASPTADLRPAVFRSLLYEACGRVVNPVYGAVGLLWSGTWHMCQAAVEAVLKGAPIVQLDTQDLQAAAHAQPPPHHLLQLQLQHQHPPNYDIRHVVKPTTSAAASPGAADAPQGQQGPEAIIQQSSSSSDSSPRLHKVAKPGRTRFKRTSSSSSTNTTNKNKPASPRTSKKATAHNQKANHEQQQQDHQQHDEQHAAVVIPSSSHQCHASSDDDHHQQPSLHSTDADADAEAGSSHITTVAPSQDDDEDDQEHQQLGLHLTLGFFASATATETAPPPIQTHHTPPPPPAAADDEPGLLLGFRFL